MNHRTHIALPTRSALQETLLQIIEETPDTAWKEYYTWKALKVSDEILSKDPVLAPLMGAVEFKAGLLRMPPYSCYHWHVDSDRGVGLNMLVFGDDSKCVFSRDYGQIICSIEELHYAPSTYYIFNTQIHHTVLNFEKPRYMFSIELLGHNRGMQFGEFIERYFPECAAS